MQTQHCSVSAYKTDRLYLPCSVATTLHTPTTYTLSMHTTHPAIPSQLPSTTLLCTQPWVPAELCGYTRARLGYAAFDAHLWKVYFVKTLYAIRTSVHAHAICWWLCVFASGHCDMSIHMIWNNPSNAKVCSGLQAPMHTTNKHKA